jgi:hypothetical protein
MNTTQTKLLESLEFTPRIVGLRVNSDGWKNYLWRVTLKRGAEAVRINFHRGTGHAKDGVPTPPKLSDVIFALLNDWQGGRETFKSFCSLFGYDTDSRKAFKIWEACKANSDKLHKLFSPDEIEELEEDFNEY